MVGTRPGTLEAAVVLAPEEPLAAARRVGLVGLVALAEAVGSHAPPDKPVTLDAAGTLSSTAPASAAGAWPGPGTVPTTRYRTGWSSPGC